MIIISYIVPVYNAQKYLVKCINSILNQNSDSIELILVDDGSKDNSATICKDYANKDDRVRYIYQSNAGVSSARNTGVCEAQGQYIRFVDSDDEICLNDEIALIGYETYYDWIVCNANVLNENEQVISSIDSSIVGDISVDSLIRRLSLKEKEVSLHYVWNHFYKRDIIRNNNLRFNKKVNLGEDFLFNVDYLKCCNTCKYIPVSVTKYFKRDNSSLTGKFRVDEIQRRRLMDAALIDLFRSYDAYEINKANIDLMIGQAGLCALEQVRHKNVKMDKKRKFLNELYKSEYYEKIVTYLKSDLYNVRSKKIMQFLIKRKSILCVCYFEYIKNRM